MLDGSVLVLVMFPLFRFFFFVLPEFGGKPFVFTQATTVWSFSLDITHKMC